MKRILAHLTSSLFTFSNFLDGPYGRGPPPPPRDFDRRGPPPPPFVNPYGPPPPHHRYPGGPPPPPRRGGDRRRDEGPPGVSLLVRNVAPSVTTKELSQAFSRIGNIRDVYIPRDYHSQQPKGFAFIEYAAPEMAREARDEMDRFVMRGRELEVVFAQERRKSPHEMRGRVVNPTNRGRPGGGGGRGGDNFERYEC